MRDPQDPLTDVTREDPVPPDEDGFEVEQGAHIDPHGQEPQDDPLPEGLEDDES